MNLITLLILIFVCFFAVFVRIALEVSKIDDWIVRKLMNTIFSKTYFCDFCFFFHFSWISVVIFYSIAGFKSLLISVDHWEIGYFFINCVASFSFNTVVSFFIYRKASEI